MAKRFFVIVMAMALSLQSWAEDAGQVGKSSIDAGPHRVWVVDNYALMKAALLDGDSGGMLGMLAGGVRLSHMKPIFSPDGSEIYQVETHFSRTWRGERSDIVAIYDGHTLEDRGEIAIPDKTAFYPVHAAGSSALSDDGRFLAVFNMTPGTSVSLVDIRTRRFLREILTPGCSMVHAVGNRRFAMTCGDGSTLVLELNEDGSTETPLRTEAFFDANKDPITDKGARFGNSWVFVSFEGYLHQVNVAADPPRAEAPWSLFTDAERADRWRIGGLKHLAVHEPSNSVYVLVHQGEADTHKDPGPEVWVYDLKSKKRVRRIEVKPEGGATMIGVSRDAKPVLFAVGGFPIMLSVYDALTGAHLRDVTDIGLYAAWLEVP